jgi:glycosidase
LNPIYPSGGKDNGYDVSSFTTIDPLYGTMNDFDDLLRELHSKRNFLCSTL